MAEPGGTYWTATRHPWSCVFFVVPLLLIYELGLHLLGPTPVAMLRNGADAWLRTGLSAAGVSAAHAAPLIVLGILVVWALFHPEMRPRDPVGVWIGMTVESVALAAALYGVCRGLWPVLHGLDSMLDGRSAAALDVAAARTPEPALVNLVRYCGAGIYEETLFRLMLFSTLLAIFTLAELPRFWSIGLATLASALVFAGAHNLGANGEAFHGPVFCFRTLAGMLFTWIFCVRGFGIAVGAHTGYDVLLGLMAAP